MTNTDTLGEEARLSRSASRGWEARSFLGKAAMHKEDEAHGWVSSLTARPDPKNNYEYNDGRCYRVHIRDNFIEHDCSRPTTNSFALIWNQ